MAVLMVIIMGGMVILFITFILSVIFDLEEGGIVIFVVLSLIFGVILGINWVDISDAMDDIEKEKVVEIVEQTVAPKEETKTETVASITDTVRVEQIPSIVTGSCETFGSVGIECINRVMLDGRWYTIHTNCEIDGWDKTIECSAK